MKRLLYVISIIGYISLISWGICRSYKNIEFGLNCEKFLNRAAEASSPQDALASLRIVLDYCEQHNLKFGSTSLIYATDNNNIGLWYTKIVASYISLDALREDASLKEYTIVVEKIHDKLTVTDDKGKTIVTYPEGISIYPYNGRYMMWAIISIFIIITSEYLLSIYAERTKKC